MLEFDQIIIWGYKVRSLNSYIHTHSWIHQGFYKGFKKLGYTTYWFDDQDKLDPKIDFKKTLFITMGDKENHKMPCRDDCYYIFHNSNIPPFFNKGVSKKNYMVLQVYTHDCIGRNLERVDYDNPYHLYNLEQHILYMTWATDLFPNEIEENIKQIRKFKVTPVINFVGMCIEPWGMFSRAARKRGVRFTSVGGFNPRKVSSADNMRLVQSSLMAPSIVCKFQEDKGYIPCRIYKNISYGKFGITNSKAVNKLFNNELIYDSDVEKLFLKAYTVIQGGKTNFDTLEKHMRFVAENHTYLNRCQMMIDMFGKILDHQKQ